jgi:TatD DNase family protein
MVYDVHAHIDLYDDKKNVISYIENKKIYTISMTNLPEIYLDYQKSTLPLKYIRFALGFHPELVEKYKSQIDCFLKLLPDVKYVGEIGLDFSHGKTTNDKNIQLKIFNEILANCKICLDKKILNIHSRNATKEVIDILNGYHGKVIMHWFSGNIFDLNNGINAGCYFSINNQMVDTPHGKELIEQVPINKILMETDAPFTKMSKTKYNIENLIYIYKQLAFIKKMNYDDLIKQLSSNFYSLIDIT